MERWPALLTQSQAADYLSVCEKTLQRLKAAEEIKSVMIRGGSIIRFRRTDLDRFIEELPEGNGKFDRHQRG